MTRHIPAGVVVALLLCALLACSTNGDDHQHDDNNFRPDVIACEDALDRLIACCPGFDATPVLCNFYYDADQGCTSSTTSSVKPALSEDESRCIRETSCDGLVANKICERAQAARAYTYDQTTSTIGTSSGHASSSGYSAQQSTTSAPVVSTHAPVCP